MRMSVAPVLQAICGICRCDPAGARGEKRLTMANYTPEQMAVFLRRCAKHLCDDSCPWCGDAVRCDEKLMEAAAELLEEVAEDD